MDKRTPKVLAIIVNTNNDECAIECMRTLRASDYEIDILLIDHSAGPRLFFKEDNLADEVFTAKNRGFASACNIGIKWALENSFDFVWLVNDDLFVAPDTLPILLKEIQKVPKAACCCPKIVRFDSPVTVQFAGGFKPRELSHWYPRGDFEADSGQYECVEISDWLSGGCLLVDTNAVKDIGFLDENFFLYYDDVDWCLRANNAGWHCVYVGISKTRHKHSLTTGRKTGFKEYYYPRAFLLFIAKHYPKLVLPAMRRYYHHYFRPHVHSLEWAKVLIDLKVISGFLARRLKVLLLGYRTDCVAGKSTPAMLPEG